MSSKLGWPTHVAKNSCLKICYKYSFPRLEWVRSGVMDGTPSGARDVCVMSGHRLQRGICGIVSACASLLHAIQQPRYGCSVSLHLNENIFSKNQTWSKSQQVNICLLLVVSSTRTFLHLSVHPSGVATRLLLHLQAFIICRPSSAL